MTFSRRTFIGTMAAGLAASACGGDRGSAAQKKEAKNVIFCVVDGMAVSVATIVDGLSRATSGKPSYWCSLMSEPYATNGLQHTRSLSSVVTDSSAASSAWGCGRRIWNGQVNMFPDGTPLRTLHEIMKEKGMRTGLVTTTTVTHATPAGFAASIASRGNEPGIAVQYLERGVDVLMGGGDRVFSPTLRADKRDLYDEFVLSDYTVMQAREALLGLRADKILGIFGNGHLPYTVDRDNSEDIKAKVPTLAEMARTAIDNLKGASEGFLLQIEGGKVDHAGHAADIGGMVFDQIAFEEAVKVAVDFALQDGETLVIVTADHATGGPSLNGAGEEYFDSSAGMESILKTKGSYDVVIPQLRNNATVSGVKDVLKQYYSIEATDAEAQAIVDSLKGEHPLGLSQFDRSVNMTLAAVLANYNTVGFTSQNHTSDHVLVTAVGPGSEQYGKLTENTAFFDMILGARGWTWSNPTMTFEEAQRHIGAMRARERYALAEDEPRQHALA